jgi:signal transduction histidine kinase
MSISDNGIGISSSNIPYIYDKFYRVPNNNRHDVKGYGLGLYYVKQIMNKMKGDIVVESELGKGTTFTLFFKNKS